MAKSSGSRRLAALPEVGQGEATEAVLEFSVSYSSNQHQMAMFSSSNQHQMAMFIPCLKKKKQNMSSPHKAPCFHIGRTTIQECGLFSISIVDFTE
ncbi:hypothetical protein L9F63_022774, partial [Diploptera punctata]